MLIRETSGIRIKGNHSSIHGESKEYAQVRSFVITIFENRLTCYVITQICILSWIDIQAKGPKGQRAKGTVCRTRSTVSRGGPF
jgi:hypothetical protein